MVLALSGANTVWPNSYILAGSIHCTPFLETTALQLDYYRLEEVSIQCLSTLPVHTFLITKDNKSACRPISKPGIRDSIK